MAEIVQPRVMIEGNVNRVGASRFAGRTKHMSGAGPLAFQAGQAIGSWLGDGAGPVDLTHLGSFAANDPSIQASQYLPGGIGKAFLAQGIQAAVAKRGAALSQLTEEMLGGQLKNEAGYIDMNMVIGRARQLGFNQPDDLVTLASITKPLMEAETKAEGQMMQYALGKALEMDPDSVARGEGALASNIVAWGEQNGRRLNPVLARNVAEAAIPGLQRAALKEGVAAIVNGQVQPDAMPGELNEVKLLLAGARASGAVDQNGYENYVQMLSTYLPAGEAERLLAASPAIAAQKRNLEQDMTQHTQRLGQDASQHRERMTQSQSQFETLRADRTADREDEQAFRVQQDEADRIERREGFEREVAAKRSIAAAGAIEGDPVLQRQREAAYRKAITSLPEQIAALGSGGKAPKRTTEELHSIARGAQAVAPRNTTLRVPGPSDASNGFEEVGGQLGAAIQARIPGAVVMGNDLNEALIVSPMGDMQFSFKEFSKNGTLVEPASKPSWWQSFWKPDQPRGATPAQTPQTPAVGRPVNVGRFKVVEK